MVSLSTVEGARLLGRIDASLGADKSREEVGISLQPDATQRSHVASYHNRFSEVIAGAKGRAIVTSRYACGPLRAGQPPGRCLATVVAR